MKKSENESQPESNNGNRRGQRKKEVITIARRKINVRKLRSF